MSRTSETHSTEIRCGCGKCLAKDGMIKCSRCNELTSLATSQAQAAAYHLAGIALCASIMESSEQPVTVTIKQHPDRSGYVQLEPKTERPLLTIDDMKRKLIIVMSGVAAERVTGQTSSTTHAADFRRAYAIAADIVEIEGASDDIGRALVLVTDALLEAMSLIASNADRHKLLVTTLLEKGELTAEDLTRLA